MIGAEHWQADLGDPSSLPAALVGIHTVIDCATARPEESTSKVDWDGKVSHEAAVSSVVDAVVLHLYSLAQRPE